MKKIMWVIIICLFLSCASYAQEGLTYIRSDRFSSSSINIVNVDEFIQIINENGIKTVFFTDSQFVVQGNSLVYTITRKGYNTLADYKNGNSNFDDGESYYLGQEAGLRNQQEVDYYRQEAFITPSDYRDAVRLGFSPLNSETGGRLYGLISRENLQRSIRFANIAIYLRYYYNWPQQYDRGRITTGRGAELIENTDINYLVNQSQGAISKLNNHDYYIMNLQILEKKDSFLYYAVRMAQYTNYSEYTANAGPYSIKGTDTILRQLGYNDFNDMLTADRNGYNNSADYYLAVNYRIGKDALESNRPLIREIEATKQRYNLTSNQQAMLLNYILKKPRGMPYSINSLITEYTQEYRNNPVASAQGWPSAETFNQMFSTAANIDRVIQYNSSGGALYIR